MNVADKPLCDAGKCAVLLESFAKSKARTIDGLANRITYVIEGVLTDLGVSATDTVVRAAVAQRMQAMIAESDGR